MFKDFFASDFRVKAIKYSYYEEFDKAVLEFANKTFPELLETLTNVEKQQFLE